MKVIRAVNCKLQVDGKLTTVLLETLQRFADCCNDVLAISKEHKTSDKVKLQHLCYHQLKAKYNLQANLIIRAIAKAAETIKDKKRPNRFKPASIPLDARTFAFIESKEKVSISTYAGRKHIKLALGNFQRSLLRRQKPKSATLYYKENKKAFYIKIVLEKAVVVPSESRVTKSAEFGGFRTSSDEQFESLQLSKV